MKLLATFATALLLPLSACNRDREPERVRDEPPAQDGRIAVPELVRRNLGIEFVAVERRRTAALLRLPGHFELLPSGRREYRTPMAGRVQVEVAPMQAVAEGDVLFVLDSPEWRRTQRDLQDLVIARGVTEARIASMTPLLAAHEAHEQSLEHARSVVAERVLQLEATQRDIGGGAEELAAARLQKAQLDSDLAEVAEKHAELMATQAELAAELAANRERFLFELEAAAAISALTPEQLSAAAPDGVPRWRSQRLVPIRATSAGIADTVPVATGAWVEANALVVQVVDLQKLRFRARGLQSDLPSLRDGLPARVVPPRAQRDGEPAISGTLQLGVEADADQRTLDLFVVADRVPSWARPEVAAFVEIETESGAVAELAIPSRAVLQDGLDRVFFRRANDDPDQVIRMLADLGVDDGTYVEVKSGLADGDFVVLDGAYELVLATSGTIQKGGHFHADGTFHADDEDH